MGRLPYDYDYESSLLIQQTKYDGPGCGSVRMVESLRPQSLGPAADEEFQYGLRSLGRLGSALLTFSRLQGKRNRRPGFNNKAITRPHSMNL